ncbi:MULTISPECIES: HNH endonuclease [unclassified Rhizobium]|jgi:5-methylcytosine-specific restriction protein A|uniref:HNH endonuclease n=1 Tax=unclassified Rhizobium TaxID=2613769 RepID=UPI00064825FE|nr:MULTISPECIES: HNH endonuclease [unclassified Rhizobium]OJY61658.1 MAG: hypothetical protein BGP09_04960 [Rhizobium sp. 60-20]RKD50407.1 HNH endonuclease [Rhizobium sp. WW_1]
MLFKELVTDSDQLMGVKAVYGRSTVSLIAFGPRGGFDKEPNKFFMLGRTTAEASLNAPYLISIGGGAEVSDEWRGRVLEVMRVTGVYGKTSDFVTDEANLARMKQWPIATVLSEVYTIEGEPLLVEDLGFPDRRILENAYDTVRRDPEQIVILWNALKDRKIARRHEILPPSGFIDRGKLVHVGSIYPQVNPKSKEGERIYKRMREIERDRRLSKSKKEINRSENGGRIACESCDFSDENSTMFDVHHLYPIHAGVRETTLADLAVLCPTCHRWSHAKGVDQLNPLSIANLSQQRSAMSL